MASGALKKGKIARISSGDVCVLEVSRLLARPFDSSKTALTENSIPRCTDASGLR